MPKAFVSSTYEDLKDHRAFVIKALRDSGIQVDPMENWTAAIDEPKRFSQKRVEGCDLCVLLLALRRGHVPKKRKLSITQLEYRKAKSLGIDILPFLLEEEAPWSHSFDELDRDPELRRWRRELKETKGVGFFGLEPESIPIKTALNRWLLQKAKDKGRKPSHGPVSKKSPPTDTELYLRSLWRSSAFIDIRGLQVGENRAFRFPIEDLYITLTTTLARKDADSRAEAKSKVDSLESRSSPLQEALSSPRLVVIGDPGSGKTTFLRRIACALCLTRLGDEPEAARERLGLEGRSFPIFARLGELHDCISQYRKAPDSAAPKTSGAARWLPYFLAKQSEDAETGLDDAFFRKALTTGEAFILLDGLDEVPGLAKRSRISKLVENISQTYSGCPIVVTTRPGAYRDEVVLPDFEHVRIDPLRTEAMGAFLSRWCQALYPEAPTEAGRHRKELLEALQRPEIRAMANNPVMLTALAVVHWNERRLPEQRADLYESIIKWLARSRNREDRPQRPAADRAVTILEELALAMQLHSEGRRTQVDKRWAAESIAGELRHDTEKQRLQAAHDFLDEEELDSGIVVGRGNQTRFWHLTFQEYLAARAIAGRTEPEQRKILLKGERLYQSEWREVVLLFAGILHQLGRRRVDGFVSALLDRLGENAALTEMARCVGLIGHIQRDLDPLDYRVPDDRYRELLGTVMLIFERRGWKVPVRYRIQVAEALGQSGDPRLDKSRKDKWVTIPAGSFWMGAQANDPAGKNYDPEAEEREAPVHRVALSSYRIGRYPVTVQEYMHFVNAGGYEQRDHWKQGGFGNYEKPWDGEDQMTYPNRPVVSVTWYEAAAYCAWAGGRLPTEAEWEFAARGAEGRRYPWGDEAPSPELLNFGESGIGSPTPVGIYPRGATAEGVCDLCGNVWEWVADLYDAYRSEPQKNPSGPSTSGGRVIRGGCFDFSADTARASCRFWGLPGIRIVLRGFRVLLPAAPARQ